MAQNPNCAQVPDWANLALLGIKHPSSYSIEDDFFGDPSNLIVFWGELFTQCFKIPNGTLRSGEIVVEPTSFQKGGAFQVLVDQKWWSVEDVTFLEGGMSVTYKSPNRSQRTFMFSAMKWDLSFQ
jgi:hypothetical protein